MTALAWALVACALAAAAADWLAVARSIRRLELVAKPLAISLILGVALALDPVNEGRRWWFVAALALGLCGDVLLMLEERFFVAGLASFLVGHACYVAGIVVRGPGRGLAPLECLVAGAVVLAVTSYPAWQILVSVRRRHTQLLVPVVVYMAAIVTMAAVALDSGNGLAALGAVMFVASDTTLAWNRFVRRLEAGPMVVIVTYHVAQLLLATSLTR